MKRDVIFAHELGIGDIIGPLIGAPPSLPIAAFARIDPFLGTGDVFDWRIKPDIENFAFHPGPIGVTAFHGHTPIQITGNPPILKAIPIVQPFFRNGSGEYGPICFAVNPGL